MSLKQRRQQAIARLIAQQAVTNQPQLVELLGTEGITATQATVSRDLDELGAIKIRMPGGPSSYALPELESDRLVPFDQLRRVLGEWVGDVSRSANLVVLRTPPGCANAVARAIDEVALPEVAGCIAGDDTIFLAAREGVAAAELAEQLRHHLEGE